MRKNVKEEIKGWEMVTAIHPGEFLVEVLDEFSITQKDLAQRIGMSEKAVNEIVKGKNPITRKTASHLSNVFPFSETYWTNLQSQYEEDILKLQKESELKEEAKVYLCDPDLTETYKELSRFGLVDKLRNTASNAGDIILNLRQFFGVSSLKNVEGCHTSQIAFRKHKGRSFNRYTTVAWLQLGMKKAQKTRVGHFDKSALKTKLEDMAQLSQEDSSVYLPKLEEMLKDCGIVLAYMPYFKNTHAQGAATWVSPDKALIMITTTRKSEDRFWFNVFHEIGHILKHGKKECYVDLEEEGVSRRNERVEREADLFAEKYLIPDFARVRRSIMESEDVKQAILNISKKIKRSPAVIAGRIAHECKKEGGNIYGHSIISVFFKNKIDYNNVLNTS
ncbi:MAG: HigA family addiction module antitoxin [Candidatus Kaiserbacteria bacterium]|nr:HigA family addiction module antitoxin [Candidatus Kaiserbacteria bacterium]